MKRIIFPLCFFYIFFTSYTFSQDKLLEGIAAIVGDQIILHSEVTQFAVQMALQLEIDIQKNPEKFQELQKNTLDNLITQKVLLEKAKEDTITIDDAQVDQVLNDQIRQWTGQLGSESQVEEYFGKPIGKIKRQFREDVKNRLMVEQVQQIFVLKIGIIRPEVEEFYNTMKDSLPEMGEMVHINVLLREIRAGGEGRQNALEKITGIRNRIINGEDFASLAKEFSQDPGSASNGGELGMIQRGDFVREFEEVAFKLKPSELSEIVETKFGFHIIQLIEKRGEKINVRHILVQLKADRSDSDITRSFLTAIRDSIQTEEDFIAMAKKHSDDETSKDSGGDLGWFEIDKLQIQEFKNAVQGLEIGEVSQPFLTEFGYFIIRLNKKRESGKLSLEDDWQQIEQFALNQKRNKSMIEWIDDLKTKVYIEIKKQAGMN